MNSYACLVYHDGAESISDTSCVLIMNVETVPDVLSVFENLKISIDRVASATLLSESSTLSEVEEQLFN